MDYCCAGTILPNLFLREWRRQEGSAYFKEWATSMLIRYRKPRDNGLLLKGSLWCVGQVFSFHSLFPYTKPPPFRCKCMLQGISTFQAQKQLLSSKHRVFFTCPHLSAIEKNNYRPIFLINIDPKILKKAIWIQKHFRMMIHPDQAKYIPCIQGWFNIWKLINVLYHINKLKNKNHMTTLVDTKKAFDNKNNILSWWK